MIPEDKDPIWKLLGQLPPVEVRSDFEKSVLSRLDEQENTEKIVPFAKRLPVRALSAMAASIAIAVSVWFLMDSQRGEPSFTTTDHIAQSEPAEHTEESVAELRQLYYMEDLLHDHDVDAMADEEIALLLFATSQ